MASNAAARTASGAILVDTLVRRDLNLHLFAHRSPSTESLLAERDLATGLVTTRRNEILPK